MNFIHILKRALTTKLSYCTITTVVRFSVSLLAVRGDDASSTRQARTFDTRKTVSALLIPNRGT